MVRANVLRHCLALFNGCSVCAFALLLTRCRRWLSVRSPLCCGWIFGDPACASFCKRKKHFRISAMGVSILFAQGRGQYASYGFFTGFACCSSSHESMPKFLQPRCGGGTLCVCSTLTARSSVFSCIYFSSHQAVASRCGFKVASYTQI